jgi:hypothetical protein
MPYASTEAELSSGHEVGPLVVLEGIAEAVTEDESTNYRSLSAGDEDVSSNGKTDQGCHCHQHHGGRVLLH